MLDVLIVDGELAVQRDISALLVRLGHRAAVCANAREASRQLSEHQYDLVLASQSVDALRRDAGSAELVRFTPDRTDEVVDAVRSCERRRARAGSDAGLEPDVESLLAASPSLRALRERIDSIAKSDAPVLLTGESGTGKELVARAIHNASSRRDARFVAVNCAAFPDTLIEEELFGHERGAFTGAVRSRPGRFRVADHGTLFLDEIAELSPPAQAKLLRVLQEMQFEALGSDRPQRVDVRLISATNRDLRALLREGAFREDLFYRIKVVDLHLPALRDRRRDLPHLVEQFLARFAGGDHEPPALTPRAYAALAAHPFPGNLRELQHALRHALVMSRGETIDLVHLPAEIAGGDESADAASPGERSEATLLPLHEAVREFEREYLIRALRAAGGVRTRAAELLGISRKSLWEKLRDHGICVDDVVDDT